MEPSGQLNFIVDLALAALLIFLVFFWKS